MPIDQLSLLWLIAHKRPVWDKDLEKRFVRCCDISSSSSSVSYSGIKRLDKQLFHHLNPRIENVFGPSTIKTGMVQYKLLTGLISISTVCSREIRFTEFYFEYVSSINVFFR